MFYMPNVVFISALNLAMRDCHWHADFEVPSQLFDDSSSSLRTENSYCTYYSVSVGFAVWMRVGRAGGRGQGCVAGTGAEPSFWKACFLKRAPKNFTPRHPIFLHTPKHKKNWPTPYNEQPDIHPPARYFLLLSERLATSRCFQRCHDPQLPCRKPHESFSTPRGSEYSRLCHLPNIPTDRRAGVAIVSHLELLDDIGQTRVEHASGSFDIERKYAIADRICHPILLDV